jgi:hypothetical protein
MSLKQAGALFLMNAFLSHCSGPDTSSTGTELTMMQAAELSRPALHCIQQPYAYKPGHVLTCRQISGISGDTAYPIRVGEHTNART